MVSNFNVLKKQLKNEKAMNLQNMFVVISPTVALALTLFHCYSFYPYYSIAGALLRFTCIQLIPPSLLDEKPPIQLWSSAVFGNLTKVVKMLRDFSLFFPFSLP